jgi:coenzyme PQQ precursor peptide PqqA
MSSEAASRPSWLVAIGLQRRNAMSKSDRDDGEMIMAWTTPIIAEICISLEINGYLPAEF